MSAADAHVRGARRAGVALLALALAGLGALAAMTEPARAQEAPTGAGAEAEPTEATGGGPDATAGDLAITSAVTSGAPEVRLTVTAPRALVGADLPASAFTVEEDGQPRAVEVRHLADEALQVVLLLDTSGSMAGEPLAAVQQAATAFVERMPVGAQLAVIGFATEPREAGGFTEDRAATGAAIAGLAADGRTATYDALMRALAAFEPLEAGRRVVVLLTDGEDNQSTTSLENTAAALAASGVTLQVVELQTRFSDPDALRRLAEAGGGEVTSISDPAALTAAYDAIASGLLDQYELAFEAEGSGETLVAVRVEHDGALLAAERAVTLPEPPAPTPTATPEPTESEALAPPPAPRVVDITPSGWLGRLIASPTALGIGALLVFLALALVVQLALAPKPVQSTLRSGVWERTEGARSGGLASLGSWAEQRIDDTLRRRGLSARVNRRLEETGILLRPAEFVVVVGAGMLVALAVGVLVSGPLLGLLLVAVGVVGVRLYLSMRLTRRRAAFAEQLGDMLQLLSGSLRAGHGLLQAVDSVAREADSPTAEEFRRVVVEARLGRDLGDALRAMGERMASDDFAWVIQAIEIHREVGGDLAEVLDRVAETIRAREGVARQIRSLSAEGRLSAKVLIGLPIFVMAAMAVINPGYMDDLVGTGSGRLMLGIATLLMIGGALWINRLVRIEY